VKVTTYTQLVVIGGLCIGLAAVASACSPEQQTNSGDDSIWTGTGGGGTGEASPLHTGSGGSTFIAGGENAAQGGGAGTEICAKKNVSTTRKPINLILAVDRSTTMGITPFGTYLTRWDAIRTALIVEPDGIVSAYQGSIRFGFEGFTGFPPDNCPNVVSVPHALNNYKKILEVFDAITTVPLVMPTGQTPTGEALKVIVDKLEPQVKAKLDVNVDPFYMLIATDGLPDSCAVPEAEDDPAAHPEAMQSVIDQIKRAYQLGIKSFVLSVGPDVSDAHLQDVANAGVGSSKARFWKVDDDQGLRDALSAIIGAASSCQLKLEGTITNVNKACQWGSVVLNSKKLPCNDQDGWRVVSPTEIELIGPSCTQYKNDLKAVLSVTFPCDVIVLQ
jgi:hypothetical protein